MKEISEIIKIQKVVIGYILNNPGLYISNIDLFSRELFTDSTCKAVISAVNELSKTGETDLLKIVEKTGLKIDQVAELYTAADYNIDFKTAIGYLINDQITISLIKYTAEVNSRITKGDDIYKILADLKQFIDSNDLKPVKRITRIDEQIRNLAKHMDMVNQNKVTGIRTGLSQFDKHTGGLQGTDLIIIAAETSQGKTSLALSIAFNAAVNNAAKVAIFSMEMSDIQITARLAAMQTGISSKKLLFHPLTRYDWEVFSMKFGTLSNADIYIDDCSSSNIDYIIS